ncbi:MAG TPA: trehalase family glycosidase [Bryobacteraceae bacterium]|nr:trehalase family glycosidase [Bryobacteraceae bacterium]
MIRRLSRRALLFVSAALARGEYVLRRDDYRHHFDEFNSAPTASAISYIPDEESFDWVSENYPFFACPDPEFERTYYYRCWTFRKHLRRTPAGFIFTEFLRPVRHATDQNAISCALGHHIADGRWIRNPVYLDEYIRFWLTSGEGGGLQRHYHQFSNWTAWAAYQRWLGDGRTGELVDLLDPLIADYELWEKDRLLPSGLFWQYDVRDGMEESISGGRKEKNARPTINSYMYGNARALSRIARLAGRLRVAAEYARKAERLTTLIDRMLWDPEARFYKTRLESGTLADVREEIGFTPWFIDPAREGKQQAWLQLTDPKGFRAPFGPTTAEQRHPGFRIAESGDDCQWNGPSWPFSTTVTLTALANLLNSSSQGPLTAADYFETLRTYALSQRLTLPTGRKIAFIDENLNPYTGEWHARARKVAKGTYYGRGDHYNHSAFCDLVITGLCGLRPRPGPIVEVNPLLPQGAWDWFCLDGVPYHGRSLAILWDRDGSRFGRGSGLRAFDGGRLIAHSSRLGRLRGKLGSR